VRSWIRIRGPRTEEQQSRAEQAFPSLGAQCSAAAAAKAKRERLPRRPCPSIRQLFSSADRIDQGQGRPSKPWPLADRIELIFMPPPHREGVASPSSLLPHVDVCVAWPGRPRRINCKRWVSELPLPRARRAYKTTGGAPAPRKRLRLRLLWWSGSSGGV
jgi:hypothetical protein